ncbi:hypothetical protein MRB53_038991 [Persea americana]|nr:hypothetical protein MRB53_038991 [Persea americana]
MVANNAFGHKPSNQNSSGLGGLAQSFLSSGNNHNSSNQQSGSAGAMASQMLGNFLGGNNNNNHQQQQSSGLSGFFSGGQAQQNQTNYGSNHQSSGLSSFLGASSGSSQQQFSSYSAGQHPSSQHGQSNAYGSSGAGQSSGGNFFGKPAQWHSWLGNSNGVYTGTAPPAQYTPGAQAQQPYKPGTNSQDSSNYGQQQPSSHIPPSSAYSSQTHSQYGGSTPAYALLRQLRRSRLRKTAVVLRTSGSEPSAKLARTAKLWQHADQRPKLSEL